MVETGGVAGSNGMDGTCM
jgi:hypothetical protein